MNRILFIRHGATAGNLQKRYIGRTDEPLCRQGVEQVLKLRGRALQTDFLFVSPMRRTRQTAALLFPRTAGVVVEGFSETDFGIFEGKTAQELAASPEYQEWVGSMCLAPIPGGESVSAFKQRCCDAFSAVMAEVPEGARAAFVIHGGVIMAILEALGQPPHEFYDYHIGNGQMISCLYRDKCIFLEE